MGHRTTPPGSLFPADDSDMIRTPFGSIVERKFQRTTRPTHTRACLRTVASKGCTCGLEADREAAGLCPSCGEAWERCDDCSPRPEGEW